MTKHDGAVLQMESGQTASFTLTTGEQVNATFVGIEPIPRPDPNAVYGGEKFIFDIEGVKHVITANRTIGNPSISISPLITVTDDDTPSPRGYVTALERHDSK